MLATFCLQVLERVIYVQQDLIGLKYYSWDFPANWKMKRWDLSTSVVFICLSLPPKIALFLTFGTVSVVKTMNSCQKLSHKVIFCCRVPWIFLAISDLISLCFFCDLCIGILALSQFNFEAKQKHLFRE